jgi:hypothetical protein
MQALVLSRGQLALSSAEMNNVGGHGDLFDPFAGDPDWHQFCLQTIGCENHARGVW